MARLLCWLERLCGGGGKVEPERLTTRLGDSVTVFERHSAGLVFGVSERHRQFVRWEIVPQVFVNDHIIEEAKARLEATQP